MNARRRALVACVLLALLGLVGCSDSGPTMGQVVFEDGSPVFAGSIEFRDVEDGDRFASRIKAGWFQPEDKQGKPGLPPGKYEIVVVQVVMTEDLAKEAHRHGNTVPTRYADYHTSGLTTTIGPKQVDGLKVIVAAE